MLTRDGGMYSCGHVALCWSRDPDSSLVGGGSIQTTRHTACRRILTRSTTERHSSNTLQG